MGDQQTERIVLELTDSEYVTLLDCIGYAKENAVTSTGRVEIDQLRKEVIKQHDQK